MVQRGDLRRYRGRIYRNPQSPYQHPPPQSNHSAPPAAPAEHGPLHDPDPISSPINPSAALARDPESFLVPVFRSEERRVGKECRSRWSAEHEKKKERTQTEMRRGYREWRVGDRDGSIV